MFLSMLISCGGFSEENRLNKTVFSGEQITGLVNGKIPGTVTVAGMDDNSVPRCGTVSHHLLSAPVINAWFKQLKNSTDSAGIKSFIIISPNHYRSGLSCISLTSRDWLTAGTVTKIDTAIVKRISDNLGIKEDNTAFFNEHGIEALLPFINFYFPESKIAPVLIDNKQKNMRRIDDLGSVVTEIISGNKNIFLLISVDFSHREGKKQTALNDIKSEKSILSLGANGLLPCSDNTPGIKILFTVCNTLGIKNSYIFCHTSAEKFNALTPANEITSYFFTFQY